MLNYLSTCINIQLSSGAYQHVAMEIVRTIKTSDVVENDHMTAKCVNIESRTDKQARFVESLVYFEMEEKECQSKVNIHYSSTAQQMTVMGAEMSSFVDEAFLARLWRVEL